LDAVTSQRGATDGKVRLVWLWPVSVSRTALPRVSQFLRGEGRTRPPVQLTVHHLLRETYPL